ncbi:MAG: adenylate kinase [Christensenellaceae bacterium]|nr:adenylate kinase [Christensenellaceae bacterium]
MNVIFLGPPGAGKGTHAQKISQEFSIPQISTGDILRQAIKDGTEVGLKAKEYMDAGKLVPDSVVIAIAEQRLKADDCKKGYILDGFPRTVAQAEALDKIADIDFVVDIDVDDEVIVKRLSGRRVCPDCQTVYHVDFEGYSPICAKCGGNVIQRKDDNEDTIRERLSVYAQQTAPLIDYYKKAGKLIVVDGAKPVSEVFADVKKAFEA